MKYIVLLNKFSLKGRLDLVKSKIEKARCELESLIFNILNKYPKFKNQVADFNDFKEFFKSFSRDIKTYLQRQLNFCKQIWVYHDFSYIVIDYFDFTFREFNKFITLYTALKNYIKIEKTFEEQNYIHACIFVPIALALKI